eukprot:m.23225 g.23225  ORF g.23225 m.23225 type:complete len:175 (+) comp8465_c0_seq3:82-606(+)
MSWDGADWESWEGDETTAGGPNEEHSQAHTSGEDTGTLGLVDDEDEWEFSGPSSGPTPYGVTRASTSQGSQAVMHAPTSDQDLERQRKLAHNPLHFAKEQLFMARDDPTRAQQQGKITLLKRPDHSSTQHAKQSFTQQAAKGSNDADLRHKGSQSHAERMAAYSSARQRIMGPK